uniref:STAS domain-containing protein n=1 Tax=Zooxanthella nutricula TaxID=1333877 RepID=A0A7S2QJF3_9DINO
MAVAMHAAAEGQLGQSFDQHCDVANPIECSASLQTVDITVLPPDRSELAAEICQERGLQSRPMHRVGRRLLCKEGAEDGKLAKRPSGGASPLGFLWRLMPVLEVFPTMGWATARADIIAGLTVGVMVIPQSMSYASIAGLPYIYGMYSACVPTFIYAFFGQSRQLAVGPVAMVSLLVEAGLNGRLTEAECPASYDTGILRQDVHQSDLCQEQYADLAIMCAVLVGVFQILARLLKLGFLVSFLGHPVTSGFTSAAAIIIGTSQVKNIVGFKIERSEFFFITVKSFVENIRMTQPMTLGLGVAWIIFLIGSKRLARRGGRFTMVGPMGPLVGCVLGSLLLFAVAPLREEYNVNIVGEIKGGFIPVSVHKWNFGAVARVAPTALSATLIGYMESIAIGKNLAAKHNYELDAGQELLALGFSNLVGAMFSCYPVTGSFSRSAVNNATGALTQMSGLVTAVIMLCTLLFLTPMFYYLPSFVLAAIVISSVIPLVAYDEAIKLWRIKKQDFCLWVVAFLGTLAAGVLNGICLAVVLSLVIVIYESVRPQITILWRIPGTTIYRPLKQETNGAFIPSVFIARIGSSMYFANASFIKDMLMAYVDDLEEANKIEYIVLEMTPVVSVDSTAVHVLQDVVNAFRAKGVQVAFSMVGNRVEKTMRKANLRDFIGDQWFFPTVNEAVLFCLRHQKAKRVRYYSDNCDFSDGLAGGGHAVPDTPVKPGDEIGFSNDIHHACTAIFINLVKDVPMLLSAVGDVFRRNHITVRRAQVEAGDGDGENEGVKHTYFVRSVRHAGKLLDWELTALREELLAVVHANRGAASASASGRADGKSRTCEESVLRPALLQSAAAAASVLACGAEAFAVAQDLEAAQRSAYV